MIVLDQCVPRKYLRLLTDWGYDAVLMQDHIAAESSDQKVLALAQLLDAVLLTVDLDFANILDYPPQNYAGIVVMRDEHVDAIVDSLEQALVDLHRDNLRGALVIISPGRYRVRRGV
jgi:predicted nuclease of predicted toxin-antitoxin system